MDKYILTVELLEDDKAKELAIHGTPDGLETLAHALLRLVKNTKEGFFNHDHLTSDLWGGTELTLDAQSEESELINHVKVYCYKGNGFQL